MTDAHPNHPEKPAKDHDSHDDHGGVGKYLVVFLALIVLTGGSFLTYFEFWHEMFSVNVSRAFMMAVSCTKAFLVLVFFMHLKWEANWKYVLTFPACFMSVFLVVMLVPDIGYRTHRYSESRWLHAAEPQPGHVEDAAVVEAVDGAGSPGHGADTHHP